MIKVSQYDYVRTAQRVYGKQIKEIARETGHSKNTVKGLPIGDRQIMQCIINQERISKDR